MAGLPGPVRGDHHRQAHLGTNLAATHFVVDWEQQRAIYPARRMSSGRIPVVDNRADAIITITPSAKNWRVYASRLRCRDSTKPALRRTNTVRPRVQHAALLAAHERQETAASAVAYRARAGIEGTISCGTRTYALESSDPYQQDQTHVAPDAQPPVTSAPIVGYSPSRGGEAGMCPSTSAQTRSATLGRTWRVSDSWRVTTTPRRRSL